MGSFLGGFVLPLLLLTAALLNWSLISLIYLVASLFILFSAPKRGLQLSGILSLWSVVVFSILVILSQLIFLIVCAIEGDEWRVPDSWILKLIGLMSLKSWRSPLVIYFLVVQSFVAVVALIEIRRNKFTSVPWRDSCWGHSSPAFEKFGSHVRVALCLLLPAVQLTAGISNPSWISLPFFICSCVGLVDWSLTSNFLGLFRWWKPLWVYAGFKMCLLYIYQLPLVLPKMFHVIADIIGLYKLSTDCELFKIWSFLSLLLFIVLLSRVKYDLEEMDFIMSRREGLTEQLLPVKHSFFIRESRSGVRHTNVLIRGAVFRMFSINFFTYGLPVSLIALSFWSFHFASICAFGLLAYVGYIVYAFPSPFHLHRLNGLLLVFILLWAVSTYIFNVAFSLLNRKIGKDMEIWEMVGMWHYTIPGLFLLAQFCLGILIALGNLVNNSVFLYVSDGDRRYSSDNSIEEVKEETKVLIVATIAWGLRKCSRAIMLVLIFLIAMKPGFIHAVYIVFFFIYLLSHHISKRIRKSLILLCETHFAILYILQLSMVSKTLERNGSLSLEILSQLGLLDRDSTWDFLEIALLACFCAVHNHGFDMLFSFSAIVKHTPCRPIGFSILKAGLNKSVLLSVYASRATRSSSDDPSHERKIASYLSAIGRKILSIYRSFGTYIAFITILVAVYLVKPNYASFGYLFLLLIWVTGRQLVERTKRRLWFPLKVYSILVFIFIYSLSIFPSFEEWASKKVDLYLNVGYDPKAPLLDNVWESLAIVIVMQLYSYERRQSKNTRTEDLNPLQSGTLGFFRRLLVWHSQKILLIAVFYASLYPISASGFLYLIGLVICSTLPKASRIPSKSFLVYTGFLVAIEYLYQLWGKYAEMFPDQKHYDASLFLGFQVYKHGFWGIEAGLRSKVLVIAACTLQYNVFHWLTIIPPSSIEADKYEEPCPLFVSTENVLLVVSNSNGDNSTSSHDLTMKSGDSESDSSNARKFSFSHIWGNTKEGHKWNKKRIISLKKERFEVQKDTLKVYMKFWIENMFNLFGLEISMIALLLTSFAILNAISMLYIASLVTCILLDRRILKKLWPVFVFLFASFLVLEYFAIWNHVMPSNQSGSSGTDVRCHECWSISNTYFDYCRNCWLGLTVDDPRMMIGYFVVFMIACFKLRADRVSRLTGSLSYRQMTSHRKNAFIWRDLSFETKSMWTFLDYLRIYCYCHLLDLVLALILITGTFEYDILHLGYLAFALIFFRMRLTILKKKNKIFRLLRMYNFAVIVLSLAYQSPFVGDFSAGKCETVDYIYEVIGFYKYDYGFRITSRSALVEIIIFILVSLQSHMFSSKDFDYVFRYLEAEQIGAIVREQEKKAAWKTAQLQYIRESEEKKRQRNLQVEKMKSEMLNLQIELHGAEPNVSRGDVTPLSEGLRRRRTFSLQSDKHDLNFSTDKISPFDLHGSPTSVGTESPMANESALWEITEVEIDGPDSNLAGQEKDKKIKYLGKEHPLKSAVQLIEDGVSQVQSMGNQAVNNLVNFLNISPEDSDSHEPSLTDEGIHNDIEKKNVKTTTFYRSSSLQSDQSRTSESASSQIGRIFNHIWSQMRSNNDIVCYCCFVMVFLWNFSLLSMVYLGALFLYALCINTGPSYIFWVTMLIYTEIYILLQYMYQITIQHCNFSIQWTLLTEFGFPTRKITASFVISLLPLFLVYLFTLVQSSITAKDGEWVSTTGFSSFRRKVVNQKEVLASSSMKKLYEIIKNMVKMVIKNVCRYWKSLTQEAESPPYFVQLSLNVHVWPEDGIQPERIESGINQCLRIMHKQNCKEENPDSCPCASRVQVQRIEKSTESPNVALVEFEVVYSSSPKCTPTERYKSLTPAADVAKEILQAQHDGLVEKVGFTYPILSVIGGGKREVDLYAYIFGADLLVFFLVAIFYQSVIKNKSEFLEVYQLEDQFPKEYVFILIIIFFLIVVDRCIYLCSFATWKVIFYIFSLFIFTYSVTQYAWHVVPSQEHTAGVALRVIFLTKAVSLALQAVQIRYGIPHKSTLYRQFLTSNVARVNYLGYRLYRALPFLYELRCVLDWSCTTTSLTMYDWLKLEDINASLYLVKCDAVLNRAGHKHGDKQTKMTKFCNGICLFFILIIVLWAPMLMYSSGNPTNIANPIKDASVQFDIKTEGGRLTLYETTLCKRVAWNELDSVADLDPHNYLDTYNEVDIQLICCQAEASTIWLTPEVVQKKYTQSLNTSMDIKFSWVLARDRPKGKEVVKYEKNVESDDLPKPFEVEQVFNGSADRFRVYDLYPRFFRVTGSGDVRPFEQEANDVSADLILNRGSSEWWSFQETVSLNVSNCKGFTGPTAIVVSEETPQGFLGETLSKFSIWGLYITFVLAVGRFIRLQCADLRMRIPFENLPSCDRLIAICEDIYAARAEGELGVEEVLYWTVVKIYRSPHMLLEYTNSD